MNSVRKDMGKERERRRGKMVLLMYCSMAIVKLAALGSGGIDSEITHFFYHSRVCHL